MAKHEELLDVLDLGGQGPAEEQSPFDTLVSPSGQGPVISPRLFGLPKTYHVEYARDLTEADVAATTLRRNVSPKPLVAIRSSHHALAKCLASGMKPAQAALITGYNGPRISVLQRDEAFQALVADYRAEAKSVFADLAERMNNLSLDAIEILHERLQDNPEGFSIPVLLDVVKSFADRTGHGPGQEVNLRVSQSDLIDRPPRETHEEWQARRAKELAVPADVPADEPKKLN